MDMNTSQKAAKIIKTKYKHKRFKKVTHSILVLFDKIRFSPILIPKNIPSAADKMKGINSKECGRVWRMLNCTPFASIELPNTSPKTPPFLKVDNIGYKPNVTSPI
jgi:hypothetical protein